MSQKSQQKKRLPMEEEIFGIDQIVQAITYSSLPEGKKMAYLMMIADGSFSLQTLEDISLEMEVIQEGLEADVSAGATDVEQLEQQVASMESELDVLAAQSTKDMKTDVDRFLQYTSTYLESKKGEAEQSEIEDIRQRLSE